MNAKITKCCVSDAKDLYELLLQRDLIDSMGNSLIDPNQHRMVRKNQRSPSLRLRFGRRSDPALYQVEMILILLYYYYK